MDDNRNKTPMHEITGLWKRKTLAGEEILSGCNGTNRFVVLPNRGKRPGDRKPDYRLFITKEEPREDTRQRRG